MAIYADFTTLTDVLVNIGTTATGQNTLLLSLIRATAREMEAHAGGRHFYPLIETRYFDAPLGERQLDLDDDLLAATTLTNGDAAAIASSEYNLLDYNAPPYYAIRLKASSTTFWEADSDGNTERAISLLGIWGWHTLYAHAWPASGAVLTTAITDAAATTFPCTTAVIRAGDLLKIESEYVYASSVSVSSVDTVTCVRGVNGSTAATHVISSVVYRWWQPEIAQICAEAVTAKFRLRNNPVGEVVNVGGNVFQTPKDVNKFMRQRLEDIGAVRSF